MHLDGCRVSGIGYREFSKNLASERPFSREWSDSATSAGEGEGGEVDHLISLMSSKVVLIAVVRLA